MNFYMLVEGEKTEVSFYPELFKYYKPQYQQVSNLSDIQQNNFIIFSGGGMPNTKTRILNSLYDVEQFNVHHSTKIDYFIVAFDSDTFDDIPTAKQCIYDKINEFGEFNSEFKICLFIQNKCIESWFLGNTDLFPKNYGKDFEKLVEIYDVSIFDPECLPRIKNKTYGISAKYYLSTMLKQSGKRYSENYIDDVLQYNGIQSIENRCMQTNHIQSYSTVLDFIKLM